VCVCVCVRVGEWKLLEKHTGKLVSILEHVDTLPTARTMVLEVLCLLAQHGMITSCCANQLSAAPYRLHWPTDLYRQGIIQAGILSILLELLSSEQLQLPAMQTLNHLVHDDENRREIARSSVVLSKLLSFTKTQGQDRLAMTALRTITTLGLHGMHNLTRLHINNMLW
jgi:hypothetical protein